MGAYPALGALASLTLTFALALTLTHTNCASVLTTLGNYIEGDSQFCKCFFVFQSWLKGEPQSRAIWVVQVKGRAGNSILALFFFRLVVLAVPQTVICSVGCWCPSGAGVLLRMCAILPFGYDVVAAQRKSRSMYLRA